MSKEPDRRPAPEDVRAAMGQAWRDHHHARDQTWKALQIEAVLGAGLVTIDAQHASFKPTLAAAALVVAAALFGVLISWHHRKLERQKIIHIFNCERLELSLRPREDQKAWQHRGIVAATHDTSAGVKCRTLSSCVRR